jgi:hypothetical protein
MNGNGKAGVSLDSVDRVLTSLPAPFAVASSGEARFVLGPPGAFVLLASGDDVAQSADRATLLAATTRTALAEHLSWVPFIDAVVVTTANQRAAQSATAVPLDMLAELLTEGPIVIDASAIEAVTALIDEARLSTWQRGVGLPAASIDLCEPAADRTTSIT